jgi:hypothetical protein
MVLFAALAASGCGEYESDKRSAAPEAVGVVADPFSFGAPAGASKPDASGVESDEPPDDEVPYRPSNDENVIREKADVGMGKKGHYGKGFITTPLSTYWRSKEAIAFRIQVPKALSLYRATNGYFPKTQEEFVREILEPNQIKLPELPDDHRYVYDPETGELQVERPR